MRKLCLPAAILLFSACAVQNTPFVNPLFSRTLYALGNSAWDVTLTPTSIIQNCPWPGKEDWQEVYDCALIDNDYHRVKYHCRICPMNGECYSDYVEYEIGQYDREQHHYIVWEKRRQNHDGSFGKVSSHIILD